MGLKRVLGPVSAGWLVTGSMIGAGIFYTPGLVAQHLPGLAAPLLAWALGGLLAVCGAASYGELGARLPRAGGDYVYLREAFGPFWGFMTGWAAFLLTFSAAAAVMTLVSLDYLATAVPPLADPLARGKLFAAPAIVLLLTWANTVGARVAGWTTAWLTAIPIVGLVALFGGGLLAGRAEVVVPPLWVSPSAAWPVALGAGMISVYYTYSGWNAAAYVAGEIRDPERNLARALLGGTAVVALVYMLVNLVVLLVVPQAALAGSTTAGAQAARLLLDTNAERVLSAIIALALLGSANVTLMAGARVYYAMAGDGLMPARLGRTNSAGVPAVALWVGGVWTALLTTQGSVGTLLNWATLAILLLSSLAVAALFVLRARGGAKPRWSCPAYPWPPALYLVASLSVATASAYHDWRQALYGVLIVAAGAPAYLVARRYFG